MEFNNGEPTGRGSHPINHQRSNIQANSGVPNPNKSHAIKNNNSISIYGAQNDTSELKINFYIINEVLKIKILSQNGLLGVNAELWNFEIANNGIIKKYIIPNITIRIHKIIIKYRYLNTLGLRFSEGLSRNLMDF